MVETVKTDPRFVQLKRCALTQSYRFGDSLATLLDRHFYQMGLTSASLQGTTIKSVRCNAVDSPGRQKRENPSEAAACESAVEAWLNWNHADKGTLAILTPYKAQVVEISRKLDRLKSHPDYYRVEVMTVHQSQGREWDAVFFSASDGSLPGNSPWFADSTDEHDQGGSLVLNTAISRAKNHLRFFIDGPFWKGRRPSNLLTEIAHAD
jgi:superfamily I DNA/RNA helicase